MHARTCMPHTVIIYLLTSNAATIIQTNGPITKTSQITVIFPAQETCEIATSNSFAASLLVVDNSNPSLFHS